MSTATGTRSWEALFRDLQRSVPTLEHGAGDTLAALIARAQEIDSPDQGAFAALLDDIVRVCVQNGLQQILAQHGIPHPSYNYYSTFEANAPGPWDSFPTDWRAQTFPNWTVLGQQVAFPIGVPASVLTTNSDWIEYHARNGFNILTYKTVRSRAKAPHPSPNWVFLTEPSRPIPPDSPQFGPFSGGPDVWPEDRSSFSMANSFGVPSFDPDYWQADVARAQSRLLASQLLIVSVMGYYEEEEGQALVNDFATVARLAEEAGAVAIELNLSCPNTVDPKTGAVKQTLICESPENTLAIVTAVRDKLRQDSTKVVVKLSHLSNERLQAVLSPLLGGETPLIDGVSGINTVQAEITDSDGASVFPGRRHAGVSGVAIRDRARQFVTNLAEFRRTTETAFSVIGMGGVMTAGDVADLQGLGADAVQTATAAFFNPHLPQEIVNALKTEGPLSERELRALRVVAEGKAASAVEVASRARLSVHDARRALDSLAEQGRIVEKASSESQPTDRVYSLGSG